MGSPFGLEAKASPKKHQKKITKKRRLQKKNHKDDAPNPVIYGTEVFSIIFMQLTKDTPLESKYFDRPGIWE